MKNVPFPRPKSIAVAPLFRGVIWFILGGVLGLFFFASFLFIYYRNVYKDTVFPGVAVNAIDFSGKSPAEIEQYFTRKNAAIANTTFHFSYDDNVATLSARELHMGYDGKLLADQAYTVGRSDNFLANLHLIFQAYFRGINLTPLYRYDEDKVQAALKPINQRVFRKPVNAVFTVNDGKVTTFTPSLDGREIDMTSLNESLKDRIPSLLRGQQVTSITLQLPIKTTEPQITTENVNKFGIKELIGEGSSRYAGSIPNRIYNLSLAASRVNGTLVPPGGIFSMNKTIGDVSSLTGYKQAYVISGGRTILGDGGGVCQTSTTMFRAALNAGLPIVERNQHAYRVHYYEEDLGPGIDAAIYTPNIDFQFKNDTKHYILIQTENDPENLQLTFRLYGTKDGRVATIKKPVIVSSSPAPEPLYQDDPNLPNGQIKQIDFAAPGAVVYFEREVKKDGKVIITDKFTSRYRPWQAVYLRGTKT
jgi:vancomycin resistance protein YoaR